jgi:hypothetical protein
MEGDKSMTEKIDIESYTHPVCEINLNAVTKLDDQSIPSRFSIDTSSLRAIKIHSRGCAHPAILDQRAFIHVQTKNKHPHSTKKHK